MSVEIIAMPVRRRSLQRLYRTKSYPSGRLARKEVPPDDTEEGEWCLVSSHDSVHMLPKTMIFLGREECDIEVQSETVDKRHAVITFDHYLRRFKIKDLSTVNGTHVNSSRIPEQEYVTLEKNDCLHLGCDDSIIFRMERYQDRPTNGNGREEEEEEVIFSPKDEDLPAWAADKVESQDIDSPVAECQGCIVEQRIEHTCGENIPESETAHHDLDRSYSHDSIANFSLGCNTWPKKRYKTKKGSVKEIFAMEEPTPRSVDGLLDPPSQSRVLRGTGAPMNILPDELETVKKGTPLYGQPEWWGEEEADLNTEKLRSNGSSVEQQKTKRMEDPGVLEEDNSVSDKSSDKPMTQNGDTDTANNVPNTDRVSAHEGVTNMAFTVDFGDEKVKMEGKTLSDFVPSKIRKSFRERKEKAAAEKTQSSTTATSTSSVTKLAATKDRGSLDKSTPPSKSSGPVGRTSLDSQDESPTSQKKLDDLWNSSGVSTESAAIKRQRMQTSKSLSRSTDQDEEVSESSYAKPTKSSAVKRRPQASSQLKPKSVIRARKAVSQEILASSTQYTNDNATYLIDKMFQNNSTGSVDSLKQKGSSCTNTEYDLYQEAMKYDSKSKSMSQDLCYSSHTVSDNKKDSTLYPVTRVDRDAQDKKTKSREVPAPILEKSTEDVPEKEDKVSESGTYTIEGEKDSKAEDEARKNIDKVFGVDQLSLTGSSSLTDLKLKSPKSDKQEELTQNLQNLNEELEEIEKLERLRCQRPMIDSLEGEIGSVETSEYYEDNEENPNSAVPSDAPKWVTQWAALTNQKSQNKSDMELSSPGSSISDDKSPSKSNGLSRKRPGTGRRLPTIPPDAGSPTLSDKSVNKESPRTSNSDLTINGTSAQMIQTPKQRSVKISSHVSAKYQDTDSESVSLTKYDNVSSNSTPNTGGRSHRSSNGSIASMDTDMLLKDTETVMAAIEQRVGSKPRASCERGQENGYDKGRFVDSFLHDDSVYSNQSESGNLNESLDCESDTSSVVALVNGDEDFVKPSHYKSPRDVLGKGRLKLTESLPSKPVVNLSGAKSKKLESAKERKSSVEEGRSVVSDVYSDTNGDLTIRTEDLEITDSVQFSRQGSKGKGTMSMTRPNRAFALRRARADGDEIPDTSRSTSSIASSGLSSSRASASLTNVSKINTTPQKVKRPLSGKYSDRQDSSRSQASLGAQIVQRSRDNANFARTDGGRHSLRVTRSMSIPVQHPSTPTGSRSRKSDGTPSSQVHHSKSLRVTGVGARERSSSVSKPGSRTNSPKSAERNAWKRRKEYDPRKAVADAKTKGKEAAKRKTHSGDGISRSRGVTRSASFTNARDLKLSAYKGQCDSVSSTEEYSRRSSEASDVFDEGPKRGFVPYSIRSIMSSKVSTSSVDEDDMDRYVRSSSTTSSQSYDTIIVSSIYQLSLKLRSYTDKTMDKLRDTEMIENGLDSPLDDLDTQSASGEIPAYKSANQELAGVLKNLRRIEQQIKIMNKVLFPDEEHSPDTSKEKHEYLQEIERIRNELAGFQPIETPREDVWKQTDTASIESDCEELSQAEYY